MDSKKKHVSTMAEVFGNIIVGVKHVLQGLMLLLVVHFQFPDLSSIQPFDRSWYLCSLSLLFQCRLIIMEVDAQANSITLLFRLDWV